MNVRRTYQSSQANQPGWRWRLGGGDGGFSKRKAPKEKPAHVIYRREIKRSPVPIKGNMEEESIVCYEGKVFEKDTRELRSGKKLISFAITDYTYSINCKIFAKPEEAEELENAIKKRCLV